MANEVVLTSADGVLEIRLNRPEKKNALTRAMYEPVSAALEQYRFVDPRRATDWHR